MSVEEAAKISTERRHVIARLKKDLSASEREKAEAKGEVTRLLGEQLLVSAEIAHRGLPTHGL
jgi:hypothetical protein